MVDIKLVTPEEMQAAIKEYFKGFLKDITFDKLSDSITLDRIYVMTAYRHKYRVGFDFDLEKWSEDVFFNMQFHRLENIKGRLLKQEKTFYLGD